MALSFVPSISSDLCGCVNQALNQAIQGVTAQANNLLRQQTETANRLLNDAVSQLPLQTVLDSLADISDLYNTLRNRAQAGFSIDSSLGLSRTIQCIQGQIDIQLDDYLSYIDPFGIFGTITGYAARVERFINAALRGFSTNLDVHVNVCGQSGTSAQVVVDAALGSVHVGSTDRLFDISSFTTAVGLPSDYRQAFDAASGTIQRVRRLRDNIGDLTSFGGSGGILNLV